ITSSAKAEKKYKKQSGGAGLYGHCVIDIAPVPRGTGFVWEDKIFGGSIPQNFRPSVERGVRETMEQGVLTGNPLVDIKVRLLDHPGSREVHDEVLALRRGARSRSAAGDRRVSEVEGRRRRGSVSQRGLGAAHSATPAQASPRSVFASSSSPLARSTCRSCASKGLTLKDSSSSG